MVSKREVPITAKAVKPAVAHPSVKPTLSLKRNPTTPQEMLALQRTAGNQAVLRRIQAKLQVGAADDGYEREAERTATSVMTNIHRLTRRDTHSSEPNATVQHQDATVQQVESNEEEGESIQTFRDGGDHRAGFEVEGDVEAALSQEQGRGTPLAPAVQRRMEAGFGADLSDVRVHTDNAADQLNQSVQAQAFTHGKDIYFSEGSYKPGTTAGDHLLAHELTHVGQQTGVRKIARKAAIQRRFGKKNQFTRTNEVLGKTYVDASSSGAIGVFFLSDHAPDNEGKKGNTVVVKFEPGEASRSLFAENVLSDLGIRTANSQTTSLNSSAGQQIYGRIGELIGGNQENRNPVKQPTLTAKHTNAATAGALIVADFIEGATLADMAMNNTQGGTKVGHNREDMVAALNNYMVASDLGRLAVFDALLGNEDRLKSTRDQANLGNIMIVPNRGGWRVVAIDNNTDAPTLAGRAEQIISVKADKHLAKVAEENQLVDDTGRILKEDSVQAIYTESVTCEDMVDKIMNGDINKWGTYATAIRDLRANPEAFRNDLMKNFKKSIETGIASNPSNQQGFDDDIKNTINWPVVEGDVLRGIQAALKMILALNNKQLQKYYDATKSQAGQMSDEVSIAFLKLRLHAIRLWDQGMSQKEIGESLQKEAERVYGKKAKAKRVEGEEDGGKKYKANVTVTTVGGTLKKVVTKG